MAVVFKHECTQRGNLHWHGMVTQREQQTDILMAALENPEMRDYIFAFMKGIQHQIISELYYHCPACINRQTTDAQTIQILKISY